MARKGFRALVEEISHDLKPLRSKSPRKGSWGFYCWGDTVAANGGGVGGFHWEASRAGMIRFLRRYAVAIYLPHAGVDCFAIDDKVERIAAAMKAGRLSDAAAVKALNRALQHVVQFDWIGEYTELRDGNTKYAKALRKRLRDGGSAAPVRRPEQGIWREFLNQA